MAKAFGDSKIAEKCETVPLSYQTLLKRVTNMGEQVQKTLLDLIEKSSYFSFDLDESTDVSQLLIFICITQETFLQKRNCLICVCFMKQRNEKIFMVL